MPLSRQRKEELVAEYQQQIRESAAVLFTEYSGLKNRRLTTLRNKIREAGGTYQVTKLSLFKIALEEEGYPVPEMLAGVPLAMIFIGENIPEVAEAINEFAEEAEKVTIVGGLMGETVLTAEDVKALEDLPTLDELRANLVGLIAAPSQSLVNLVDAPPRQLVTVLNAGVTSLLNVLNAYANKQDEDAA